MSETAVKADPIVNIDLKFTKEDIINIKISEIETAALANIERLSDERSELETKHSKIRGSTEEALKKYCKDTFNSYGDDLEAALSKFFTKVRRVVDYSVADRDEKKVIDVCASVDCYDEINNRSGQNRISKRCDMPAFYNEALAEMADIQKKISALADSIFTEKRKLAQLAVTERRARAELSKALMGGSQGRAIMEALGKVGSSVKLLT